MGINVLLLVTVTRVTIKQVFIFGLWLNGQLTQETYREPRFLFPDTMVVSSKYDIKVSEISWVPVSHPTEMIIMDYVHESRTVDNPKLIYIHSGARFIPTSGHYL